MGPLVALPAPGDADSGSHSWTVASWSSRCREKRIDSEPFTLAGKKWCVTRPRRRATRMAVAAGRQRCTAPFRRVRASAETRHAGASCSSRKATTARTRTWRSTWTARPKRRRTCRPTTRAASHSRCTAAKRTTAEARRRGVARRRRGVYSPGALRACRLGARLRSGACRLVRSFGVPSTAGAALTPPVRVRTQGLPAVCAAGGAPAPG